MAARIPLLQPLIGTGALAVALSFFGCTSIAKAVEALTSSTTMSSPGDFRTNSSG